MLIELFALGVTAEALQENAIIHGKRSFYVFEPPFGGLRGNVRCSC